MDGLGTFSSVSSRHRLSTTTFINRAHKSAHAHFILLVDWVFHRAFFCQRHLFASNFLVCSCGSYRCCPSSAISETFLVSSWHPTAIQHLAKKPLASLAILSLYHGWTCMAATSMTIGKKQIPTLTFRTMAGSRRVRTSTASRCITRHCASSKSLIQVCVKIAIRPTFNVCSQHQDENVQPARAKPQPTKPRGQVGRPRKSATTNGNGQSRSVGTATPSAIANLEDSSPSAKKKRKARKKPLVSMMHARV